jgi:hypothetical protein
MSQSVHIRALSCSHAARNEACAQETDPGKFTLAFKDWKQGLLWAAHVKQLLPLQQYSDNLLALPELAEVHQKSGYLIQRGMRPKVLFQQIALHVERRPFSKIRVTAQLIHKRQA